MFEPQKNRPDIEVSVKQRKEIKYILEDVIKPFEGHPIFEINLRENTISIAELEPLDTVHFHHWKQQLAEREIIKKSDCRYITALNLKNLLRKFPEYKNFTYLCGEEQVVNKNRKIKLLKNEKTN